MKVVTTRSVLTPRWWQLRRRFRRRRLYRDAHLERKKLSPQARQYYDELMKDAERGILFGKDINERDE